MSIIRKKSMLCEQIGKNELMLYDESEGTTHILNSTASTFYSLCADETVENAISEYAHYYSTLNIPPCKLHDDAVAVFNSLKEKGILWEENNE